jgi:ferredoxin
VHCRVDFDFRTEAGIAKFRAFMEEAADLVASYGGSLSGEHGDGQARGELLDRMFSRELLEASREFKSIWDPDWRMNPGKVIDANPLDADLRLGPAHQPGSPMTWFRYPDDGGEFSRATQRCVGVGKCRKLDAGTMCPSYMVTREEQHTTRGRARLLFEMLHGDPLTEGWQSEAVKESLDLCLACKGCKGECPVSVDMATYKAEFLAHYYAKHFRPLTAYTFGMISRWASLAEIAPRLVNVGSQTPGLRTLAKLAAGMPLGRRIPAFAPASFRRLIARRTPMHRPRLLPPARGQLVGLLRQDRVENEPTDLQGLVTGGRAASRAAGNVAQLFREPRRVRHADHVRAGLSPQSVWHVLGETARDIARTEIHGRHHEVASRGESDRLSLHRGACGTHQRGIARRPPDHGAVFGRLDLSGHRPKAFGRDRGVRCATRVRLSIGLPHRIRPNARNRDIRPGGECRRPALHRRLRGGIPDLSQDVPLVGGSSVNGCPRSASTRK